MTLQPYESGLDTIVISGRLVSLNEYISAERGNMYHAASLKRQLEEKTIASAVMACDLGKLHKHTNPCELWITFVEENHRRDLDNISFCVKGIQDGLVKCGVFPDDSTKYINLLHYTVAFDKENPRVEVTIRENRK